MAGILFRAWEASPDRIIDGRGLDGVHFGTSTSTLSLAPFPRFAQRRTELSDQELQGCLAEVQGCEHGGKKANVWENAVERTKVQRSAINVVALATNVAGCCKISHKSQYILIDQSQTSKSSPVCLHDAETCRYISRSKRRPFIHQVNTLFVNPVANEPHNFSSAHSTPPIPSHN